MYVAIHLLDSKDLFKWNKKVYFYNSVIERVKDSNIFIGLKKTCLGGLDRRESDNNNEISLTEGGTIEIEFYGAPLRDARSLRFELLTEHF